MIFRIFKSKKANPKLQRGRHALLTPAEIEQLRKLENSWAIFKEMMVEYASDRTSALGPLILKFIGTETPLDDVLAALEEEFDSTYYLEQNPDVASATNDAVTHYLLYGWREGRNPSLFFDHKVYRKLHSIEKSVFPLAHYRSIGKATGIPANGISNCRWFEPEAPDNSLWSNAKAARRDTKTRAVIIMPVYKGYDETLAAIYHLLMSRGTSPYSLLVINDRSPNAKLNAKLFELSALGLFDYHVNQVNRGFVQTVNIGLRQLSGDLDVIIFNSDAYVFPGWFDRLISHADRDPKIATITPLSNNATICSYPRFNQDNNVALEISPEEMDRLAAKVNPGLAVNAPTGVGFCMYMRRSVIREIGDLDAQAFEIGYGEENDFCMRAIGAGYRNVVATDVFVFHKGSVSFVGIKSENFNRGQKALLRKHPNYGPAVRNHVAADPELPARRNLDAARLLLGMKDAVVFITHKWMGGIDTYLDHQRRKLEREGIKSLVLRVHDRRCVSFETWPGSAPFIPNLSNLDLAVEANFVRDLLAGLAPRFFHVNSFAGLDWASHRQMLDMIETSSIPYDYFGHDYAPISHNYHLLRPDNVFDGIPDLAKRALWIRMRDHSGSHDICDPEERLQRYRQFLKGARHVAVPSKATRTIYAVEFPDIPIAVVPHADHLPETKIAARPAGRHHLVIAVIGAIGPHKGSDVLAALAAHAKEEELPIQYHLVGYSNQDAELEKLGVTVTGRYEEETDAFWHLDRIQPDLILIPSIWPETFCYTLSLAFKKGIPPVVFDLGAQAERVHGSGCGKALSIDLASHPVSLTETLLNLPINEMWISGVSVR